MKILVTGGRDIPPSYGEPRGELAGRILNGVIQAHYGRHEGLMGEVVAALASRFEPVA